MELFCIVERVLVEELVDIEACSKARLWLCFHSIAICSARWYSSFIEVLFQTGYLCHALRVSDHLFYSLLLGLCKLHPHGLV